MLQKIVITCTCPENQNASIQWGSLFHGVLMQLLPSEIAEDMHRQDIRMFSQHVRPIENNQSIEWHVATWNQDLGDIFRNTLLPLNRVELSHKKIHLNVRKTTCDRLAMEQFLTGFFAKSEPMRKFELSFLTPCTHKSGGAYVLFPSSELIIKSLCNRLGPALEGYSLDDPQALSDLAAHIRIVRYTLRSAPYSLEGVRIQGYMGKLTLAIEGPEPLARLGAMLLSFAEYAGIGIKTSLGMGACQTNVIVKGQ